MIALAHTDLLRLAGEFDRAVTDPWTARLAAAHLQKMIESGEDMDKTLVTPSYQQLVEYAGGLAEADRGDHPRGEERNR